MYTMPYTEGHDGKISRRLDNVAVAGVMKGCG